MPGHHGVQRGVIWYLAFQSLLVYGYSVKACFRYFGVKSVQMFKYNLEYILASPNLLNCSEARGI